MNPLFTGPTLFPRQILLIDDRNPALETQLRQMMVKEGVDDIPLVLDARVPKDMVIVASASLMRDNPIERVIELALAQHEPPPVFKSAAPLQFADPDFSMDTFRKRAIADHPGEVKRAIDNCKSARRSLKRMWKKFRKYSLETYPRKPKHVVKLRKSK